MKIDLTGKLALVTGSTQGIGYAIAKGLAQAGAEVVLNGRHEVKLQEAVARLRAEVEGAKLRAVAADVGSASDCEALARAVPAVDILVNNAGIFALQDFFDTGDEVWERFFQVNVMSGVRLSRQYGQGMAERGWGRIVFISSESGLNIPPDMIHYGFTKTAQISVARGLAKRLAGTGVTVNSVLPGPTLSDGLEEMLVQEARRVGKTVEEVANAFVRKHRPSSIIQRAARVEEVANLVVYVASAQASATTGAALRVDGGVVDSIA